jgi:hypothetical protein
VRIWFNLIGLVMFIVAFGAALGISRVVGSTGNGFATLCGGVLLTALDLGWRTRRGTMRRFGGGGRMMFVPMWVWGIVWTVLGVYECVKGT